MRILVRGDLHLDLVSDGLPRLEEQRRVIEYTLEALRMLNPDVFVDLGDLFDRTRPSPLAYAAALEYAEALRFWWEGTSRARGLSKVAQLEDRTFVLAGNHDKPSRGEVSALRPLEVLHGATHRTARPVVVPTFVDVVDHDVRLVLLPFVTDWEARERGFESAQVWVDDFAEVALRDCGRAVAFAHLEVPGARLAEDERVQRDVGTAIPEVLLGDDRVLRIYAGHVHRHQMLGKVTVVGSAIHVDFGEAADPKGMVYAEV